MRFTLTDPQLNPSTGSSTLLCLFSNAAKNDILGLTLHSPPLTSPFVKQNISSPLHTPVSLQLRHHGLTLYVISGLKQEKPFEL